MQTTFSIGDLSRALGVTPRTLRFYEDKGLVEPRRSGRSRLYGARDRARIEMILLGRRVGFSLAEIKEMLDLADLKDGRATHLRIALARFGEQMQRLAQQREDIDRAIASLSRTIGLVEGILRERATEHPSANGALEPFMQAAE